MNHTYEQDYPHLFAEVTWGPISLTFQRRRVLPPTDLISNVNLVPYIGERWLVIRLENGLWELPGGTLEPGETYLETIRRELLEEAGARLVHFEPLGAWHCRSTAAAPYRPHLPHPESYRLVGYGPVELVGAPQNPEGAGRVVQVDCISLQEVYRRFRAIARLDLAELYLLAAQVRAEREGE